MPINALYHECANRLVKPCYGYDPDSRHLEICWTTVYWTGSYKLDVVSVRQIKAEKPESFYRKREGHFE